MALEDNHKRLLQFLMKNGSVKLHTATKFHDSLYNVDEEEQAPPLRDALAAINNQIKHQHFKIALVTCEVTDQELAVFLNLTHDNYESPQVEHSAVECEYFRAVLQEIVAARKHRLPHVNCINLASTLTESLPRSDGQGLLEKWSRDGYLVNYGNHVYLGARAVQEFKVYFKEKCKDYVLDCYLCSEPVFVGKHCRSCDKEMHLNCLKKFSHNRNTCPHCKTNLDEQSESEASDSS